MTQTLYGASITDHSLKQTRLLTSILNLRLVLGLSILLGWWWAEYVAAFALLIWLVPETREAVEAAVKGADVD